MPLAKYLSKNNRVTEKKSRVINKNKIENSNSIANL